MTNIEPKLLSYDSTGGVRVSIGQDEYTYVLATEKLVKAIQIFRYSTWKGLNYLKANFKYYRKEN